MLRRAATQEPRNVPTKIPITMRRTTSQRTAPRRWWARKLDTEVKMIEAMEVPRARCMMMAGSSPCQVKQNTSIGTITSPPPIPNRPARTPATAPTAR